MMPTFRSRRETVLRVLLATVFAGLCLWPYLGRLTRPTLYADDLVRVAIVRNVPLGQALVLPFNEHIAPLFELVSRTAWFASGERLSRAPAAFTVASVLPWPLVLVLLGRVVKRRTGSTASALASVAIASLSWLHVEVVEWYSASSFAWALAGILLAFDAPGPVALAASALAPAFSAVGLMAGPLGALGAILRGRTEGCSRGEIPVNRGEEALEPVEGCSACAWLGRAVGPMVGMTLFLLFAGWFGLGSVLSRSAERSLDPLAAAQAVFQAPVGVLLPALVGLAGDADGAIWKILVFGVVLLACVFWAIKDEGARPLVLGGLAMILGGYVMAYGARAEGSDVASLLRIQRYHLLPQFGLAMLLGPLVARGVSRFETRPVRSWGIGVLVAAVMLGLHGREMEKRALCYRFADQAEWLQALEHLEPEWTRAGLTRAQVFAVLGDDSSRRWCSVEGLSPWVVLGPLEERGRVPNAEAARVVFETVSERDRLVLRRR